MKKEIGEEGKIIRAKEKIAVVECLTGMAEKLEGRVLGECCLKQKLKLKKRGQWPKEFYGYFSEIKKNSGNKSGYKKIKKIYDNYNFKKLAPKQVNQFESLMAAVGVPAAQRYMAQAFDYGWNGQKRDSFMAEVWYALAANNGDTKAAYNLAEIYSDREENLSEIIALLKKCVADGDSEAAVSLGRIYFHGIGTKRNVAKGLSLYKKAANKKSPRAIYNLGFCYAYGDEVKKDLTIARSYYKKLLKLDKTLAKKLAKYLK